MTEYRYVGVAPRVYVDRSLLVAWGDVVEWPDGAPDDGQWEPIKPAKKQPAVAPPAENTDAEAKPSGASKTSQEG